MKRIAIAALMACAAAAVAQAAPKSYQVTGSIVSITDDTITVQRPGEKGEKWEVGRDANTKGVADVKAGDKVTIHYTMMATDVTVKPAAAPKSAPAKSAPKSASAKTTKTTTTTASKTSTAKTTAAQPAAAGK